MNEEFKRINFFKGFFTQAEDWQAAETYHVEKRKIHNRYLHTPGIVFGTPENLMVSASQEGTSLKVGPGYAIDGEGRDLWMPEAKNISVNLQDFNPPATIYVAISYQEEKIDRRPDSAKPEYSANPEYTGHAFIKEFAKLDVTSEKPDNKDAIELARVELKEEATRLKNPQDPDNPGPDEIDRRFIKRAGAVASRGMLEDLGKVVEHGTIRVRPSTEKKPHVLIEKISGTADAHRFYIVSAYPVEEARIQWRIESVFEGGNVEYRLFFENFSKSAADVRYRVFRLN